MSAAVGKSTAGTKRQMTTAATPGSTTGVLVGAPSKKVKIENDGVEEEDLMEIEVEFDEQTGQFVAYTRNKTPPPAPAAVPAPTTYTPAQTLQPKPAPLNPAQSKEFLKNVLQGTKVSLMYPP